MNLTKEQAIEGHRKMWNWIADKIEERKDTCIIKLLKSRYTIINEIRGLTEKCFCCEYNRKQWCEDCSKCPLDWGSKTNRLMCTHKNKEKDFKGLYSLCDYAKTWQEQVELARKIANLPVREVQNR